MNVEVQIVDNFGQNLMDEIASKEWRSCQLVHDIILIITDMMQPEPWEGIEAYQSNMVIKEGVLLCDLVDTYSTVHLTVERVTVCSSAGAPCVLTDASVCWYADNVEGFHERMKIVEEAE